MSVLLERSKKRIADFYKSENGIVIPMRMVFDATLNPSEKLILNLLGTLCRQTAENVTTQGQYYTTMNNNELATIAGGVSLRSIHRHLNVYKRLGFVITTLENSPTPNFRTIYLTPKGVKYIFNIEVDETFTMTKAIKDKMYV